MFTENNLKIKGPIGQDESSHMFSASKYCREPLDLEIYGYIEEEYFLTTTANVYRVENDNRIVLEENLPVTTRLIVRRKKEERERKNRVYVDILNASNCYDIEDLWRRSYLYIMENGYSYVGITAKPCNVFSLKNFDNARYESLNFSDGKLTNMPSVIDEYHRVSGCEEGLIWDVFTKLGIWLKEDGKSLFYSQDKKLYTYLSGQSQSGIFLNTYVNQFSDIINEYRDRLYDGYISLVGGGFQRYLNQNEADYKFMGISDYKRNKVSIPYVELNSEGDFSLFKSFGNLIRGYNSDSDDDKRRYYEVAGSAHTDVSSPLVPQNSELDKAKCKRRVLDGEIPVNLNDFPLEYIINGVLENLHKWAEKNILPPKYEGLKINGIFENRDSFEFDEFENVKGELTLPLVKVPIATYIGSTGATDGEIKYFSKEKVKKLYGSFENYFEKFKNEADIYLEKNIITREDYDRMLNLSKTKWEEHYGKEKI